MNCSIPAPTRPLPIPQANEDFQWVQETLDGDPQAFSKLMTKYKGMLFDLAARIVGNPTEAEDVLQEAFFKAYRHLANFHRKCAVSTWLYAIVLNQARNRLRRKKLVKWYSLDAPASALGREDMVIEMPDHSPSLETLVERKLDMEELRREVQKLAAHYRSTFVLHYFHNLSIQEICKTLGRPEGTVKVYLHRARKLLYRQIQAAKPKARVPAVASSASAWPTLSPSVGNPA